MPDNQDLVIKSNDDYKEIGFGTKKDIKILNLLKRKIKKAKNYEEALDIYKMYNQFYSIARINGLFMNLLPLLDETLTLDSELNDKYVCFKDPENIKFFSKLDWIVRNDLDLDDILNMIISTKREIDKNKFEYYMNDGNSFYDVEYCLQKYKLMQLNELLVKEKNKKNAKVKK